MYIQLSKELFSGEFDVNLNSLLRPALDDRIFIIFDFTNDDLIDIESWLNSHSLSVKSEWENILNTFYSRSSRLKIDKFLTVTSNEQGHSKNTEISYSLDDVLRIIEQPYRIFVENSGSDRTFFLAVINTNLKNKILELEELSRLEFVSGGGIGALKKLINNQYSKIPGISLSGFAFFDSDSPQQGQLGYGAHHLVQKLNEHNIMFHCHSRRAIENYLTENTIKGILDIDDEMEKLLVSFNLLDEQQQYFFHMKEGFSKKSCGESPLYTELDSTIRRALHNGFKNALDPVFQIDDEKLDDFHYLLLDSGACNEFDETITLLKKQYRV